MINILVLVILFYYRKVVDGEVDVDVACGVVVKVHGVVLAMVVELFGLGGFLEAAKLEH